MVSSSWLPFDRWRWNFVPAKHFASELQRLCWQCMAISASKMWSSLMPWADQSSQTQSLRSPLSWLEDFCVEWHHWDIQWRLWCGPSIKASLLHVVPGNDPCLRWRRTSLQRHCWTLPNCQRRPWTLCFMRPKSIVPQISHPYQPLFDWSVLGKSRLHRMRGFVRPETKQTSVSSFHKNASSVNPTWFEACLEICIQIAFLPETNSVATSSLEATWWQAKDTGDATWLADWSEEAQWLPKLDKTWQDWIPLKQVWYGLICLIALSFLPVSIK